jgi:hypothetical protein
MSEPLSRDRRRRRLVRGDGRPRRTKKPSVEVLLHLGNAALIGGLAGWLCHTLTQRGANAKGTGSLEQRSR